MQLIIEPVGERKLVANSELIEGERSYLFVQLISFIEELELVDEDDERQVEQWVECVTLEQAITFLNGWCDEWEARLVTN